MLEEQHLHMHMHMHMHMYMHMHMHMHMYVCMCMYYMHARCTYMMSCTWHARGMHAACTWHARARWRGCLLYLLRTLERVRMLIATSNCMCSCGGSEWMAEERSSERTWAAPKR